MRYVNYYEDERPGDRYKELEQDAATLLEDLSLITDPIARQAQAKDYLEDCYRTGKTDGYWGRYRL